MLWCVGSNEHSGGARHAMAATCGSVAPLMQLEEEQGVGGPLFTSSRLCARRQGCGVPVGAGLQSLQGHLQRARQHWPTHARARGGIGRLCWDKAACRAASVMADFGLCQQ